MAEPFGTSAWTTINITLPAKRLYRKRANEPAGQGHEEGGPNALVTNICNNERQVAAVAQFEEVEKITRNVVPKRSAVPFPHSRHFNYSCESCHHQWDRYSEPLSCTTAGCHDLKQPPAMALKDGKLTAEGIRYFTHAYHSLCRNCHREINDRNRERSGSRLLRTGDQNLMPNGPTSCRGCHPGE